MSRFRAPVLLAVLVALATAFAACGGGGGKSDEAPRKVLDSATLKGLDSGAIDLALAVKTEGKEDSDLEIGLSGPFRSRGKDLPEFDLLGSAEGTSQGEDIDFEGGLTLLSDRAYVNYKGTEYEVDPATFGIAKTSFLATKRKSGKEATTYAINECREAATALDVGNLGDNLANDGSADVDGTATTKISGDLNVPGAVDALIELAEDPACSAQLQVAGLSPDELRKARGELAGAVKKAQVEIYVGDDDIIRRLAAELVAEPTSGDFDRVEVDFELSLSEVNETPEIEAPSGAKPVGAWFRQLGLDPFELLSLSAGGEGLTVLLEKIAADAFPQAADALPKK